MTGENNFPPAALESQLRQSCSSFHAAPSRLDKLAAAESILFDDNSG